MPKHRDTTLLRRLLTQVGLMKCRYTSALLRAPPSEPKAQVPGGSGAMFPHPSRARFHLAGLSLAV